MKTFLSEHQQGDMEQDDTALARSSMISCNPGIGMEHQSRMSEEMQCRLLEACETGDADALRNAAKRGMIFYSAMLDKVAIKGHFACIDVITQQKNVCVSGLAVEYLVRHNQSDILSCLAKKNAISMAGVLALCNLASELRSES